ncbi:MAG: DUF3465 domain-containing protein [Planctomycetota bacterium]
MRDSEPKKSTGKRGLIAGLLGVVVLLLGLLTDPGRVLRELGLSAGSESTRSADAPSTTTEQASGTNLVLEAFRAHRSDVQVEVEGRVLRSLPDDTDGARHQRFVIELSGSKHSVLVAHNIDLAPRVEMQVGDRVTVAGEYEFNDQGGVLHWTHHDPAGKHEDGFVRVGSRVFR